MTLFDGSGTPISNTLTDAAGRYIFSGLPAGVYHVQFDLGSLGIYQPTTPMTGAEDGDSDADPSTGVTDSTGPLDEGDIYLHLDLGVYAPVSIGDRVWIDVNADGVQDAGETNGLPGVTVTLYNASGDMLRHTVTGADGMYLFDELPPGEYSVGFDLNSIGSHNVSPPAVATDDLDSDADPDTGRTEPSGPLGSGDSFPHLDLGVWLPVSVGDRVWLDGDANGVQESDETTGVPDVTVHLYNAAGDLLVSTHTDADGLYRFEGLPPGAYSVEFDLNTVGDLRVSPRGTGTDATDSDADADTGRSDSTGLLSGGDEFLHLDLGLYPPVTVGDRVWIDANGDGLQNADETSGVANVLVQLLNTTGAVIATTTTDTDGLYRFDGLPPGDYQVQFEPPAGYFISPEGAGDDAGDSDADPDTGRTDLTGGLTPGSDFPHLDMGLVPMHPGILLHKTVTLGTDCPGENAISHIPVDSAVTFCFHVENTGNVTLTEIELHDPLLSAMGPILEGLTLRPGESLNHSLTEIVGRDLTNVASVTGTTPEDEEVTSTDTAVVDVIEESSPTTGTIIGQVRFDDDVDGDLDDADPGISNVVIVLIQDGIPVATTRTDSVGEYRFEEVPPGDYQVVEQDPENHHSSADSDSTNDNTVHVTVEAGETEEAEFLDVALYKIEGQVREDTDGDGDLDDADGGIQGVLIELYKDGELIDSTLTDENGRYIFDGLIPGMYMVRQTDLDEYTSVNEQDLEVDNLIEVDVDGDSAIDNIDFLDARPVRIGSTVWEDLNGDGRRDSNEPGVPGVAVLLLDVDGNELARTVTDAAGQYGFSRMAGEYAVQFDLTTLPEGFVVTAQNHGDETSDSDADPSTGATRSTGMLLAGDRDLVIDMGIQRPVTIGDTVWEDLNADGSPVGDNLAALGISGTVVTLYRVMPDGSEIRVGSQITTDNGWYQFTELPAGTYRITVDLAQVPTRDEVPWMMFTTPESYTFEMVSGQTRLDADFGVVQEATAVELIRLEATATDTGNLVRWTTGSESDLLGFNLYRSRGANGERTRVNSGVIHGANRASGSEYAFVDTESNGATHYWLEDLDSSLGSTIHGPAVIDEAQPENAMQVTGAGIYSMTAQDGGAVYFGDRELPAIESEGELIFYAPAAGRVVLRYSSSAATLMAVASAAPETGVESILVEAADGSANVETDAAGNLLVLNLTANAMALDVTDPYQPVLLQAETLETQEGTAHYFHSPARRKIHIQNR